MPRKVNLVGVLGQSHLAGRFLLGSYVAVTMDQAFQGKRGEIYRVL
jgi:hypothetical protein